MSAPHALGAVSGTGIPAVGRLQHPTYGAVNYELQEVPDAPDAQVDSVIGIMIRYAREDASSPELLAAAQHIKTLAPADPLGQIELAYYRTKSAMTFQRDEQIAEPWQAATDEPVVEAFIRPRDMELYYASGGGMVGDCDDYSMWLASLLVALGIPVGYATAAADPANPYYYSHVYVIAYADGRRIPLDASHGERPGWETPAAYRRAEWSVTGSVLRWFALGSAAYLLWRICK